MRALQHWLAHRLGWNGGVVVTWWSGDRQLMVGFLCDGCQKLSGVHMAPQWITGD